MTTMDQSLFKGAGCRSDEGLQRGKFHGGLKDFAMWRKVYELVEVEELKWEANLVKIRVLGR